MRFLFCRINFNPLIQCREIQQYCIKGIVTFLQYYQKLICFPYLLPQKPSNFQELAEKSDSHAGANPPQFSCELTVRTIIILAIYIAYYSHIASPLSFVMHSLCQNGGNLIFLHEKNKVQREPHLAFNFICNMLRCIANILRPVFV